ncbi:helix-turn-helix transcriptional regulator [Methylobacterium sp. J-078]|uniref:helix-turn-helix domain-containing protein n=1 Tax=Methylobacterium sp. J-078 TaxID=2836657 RepID=UPI001FBBAEB0|nr:helix-turn-helix transcriptional regulator [Methylobacterium sp. J-078]MCJ2047779.1 helix-turn-helix transcriptional regulator [Methylobacterium sp. J-078]
MPIQPADVSRFLDRSGWSQAQLAWTLGINQPRISRFITGLKKPNPQLQAALETFFAHDPRAGAPTSRSD